MLLGYHPLLGREKTQPDSSPAHPHSLSQAALSHLALESLFLSFKWELRDFAVVVQWLRILLAMQGTRVPLVGKLRSHAWGN